MCWFFLLLLFNSLEYIVALETIKSQKPNSPNVQEESELQLLQYCLVPLLS